MLSLYSSIQLSSCCLPVTKWCNHHKVQKELTKIDKEFCLCFQVLLWEWLLHVREDKYWCFNSKLSWHFRDWEKLGFSPKNSLPPPQVPRRVSDCWVKLSWPSTKTTRPTGSTLWLSERTFVFNGWLHGETWGSEFSIVVDKLWCITAAFMLLFLGHSSPASTFACPHVKVLLFAENSKENISCFEAVKAFNCYLYLFQKFCRKSEGYPTVWWGWRSKIKFLVHVVFVMTLQVSVREEDP